MKFAQLFLVPLLLLTSTPALASVLMMPVEGVNLEAGEIAAIEQIVAASYRMESRETVIGAAEAKAALEETGSYEQATSQLGASEYIHVTATRLETKIVLSATLYSQNGQALHTAKITATSLDDIEPASERLAKALVARQSSKEVRDLDNVTQTEGSGKNLVRARDAVGFKASVTLPVSWTTSAAISPIASAGVAIRKESEAHFLEFGIGLMIPPSSDDSEYSYGGVYADMGGSFYLSNENSAPYVGFGLMPRLASLSLANLAPYGQVGMTFFRESSAIMYTEFRVAQNILPVGVRRSLGPDPNSTGFFSNDLYEREKLYPTEFTLALGIGW